ncbi:MAG: HlyC/CorC family transporter [Chitinophagales bacterium]|jgi:putative hemolysin|nr:HlyC/CorC family transporter [Chitinophagales bacterium]
MEPFAIIAALLLIAFFSGIEIAFVSANKLRVELLKEKGSSRGKIISHFNQNPGRFISTMLIGLNISLVLFGSVTANYFTPENFPFLPSGEIALLVIQTVFTTFVVLIFGELIPKILFRVNSDQSLLFFAYPAQAIFVLLKPLSDLFHALSRRLIKLVVGSDLIESKQSFTKEDLEYLVKETAVTEGEAGDETDHLNTEIFEKALYLKDVKVRNCMVPRPEIQAIELTEGIEALKKKFVETKLSRVVIYDDTIDKIIGYIHHFDLLKTGETFRQLIRPIQAIPESMTARDLMLQFIREKKNVAWVVDEYGGTAGIITLEDLMEEIFGDIQDEHDEEDLAEKKISEEEFVLSGRLEVDYLNQEYGLGIPEGEYSTLSGYIISGFEDIPEAGTTINLNGFHMKVLKASDKRIELVNLKIKKDS